MPNRMRPNAKARRLTLRETFSISGRLLKVMAKNYIGLMILAVFCIAVSAGVGVLGNVFIGDILIDEFIVPMIQGEKTYLYGIPMELSTAILIMMGIYLVGVAAAYVYQIVVSQIGQGVQRTIRDELFAKMELLPLSYFDSRPHGDVMSIYTNDIDTLVR